MYELVHLRDKTKERFQSVFFTLLDVETYEMRDLYIEHLSMPGWWRSSGRIDDVVVMADAKKLNTIPYETVIEQHPQIATALICGTGRSCPAVLVQPIEWPASEKESQPMARAGEKDTVQRKRSLQLYQEEVDEAYCRAEELGLLFGAISESGGLV